MASSLTRVLPVYNNNAYSHHQHHRATSSNLAMSWTQPCSTWRYPVRSASSCTQQITCHHNHVSLKTHMHPRRGRFITNALKDDGTQQSQAEKEDQGVAIKDVPYTKLVSRPSLDQHQGGLEEVLTVKMKLYRHDFVGFNVFLNLPFATKETPVSVAEFVGSFYRLPEGTGGSSKDNFSVSLFRNGIGETIRRLGLSEQASILVTIVPTAEKKMDLSIEDIFIDME